MKQTIALTLLLSLLLSLATCSEIPPAETTQSFPAQFPTEGETKPTNPVAPTLPTDSTDHFRPDSTEATEDITPSAPADQPTEPDMQEPPADEEQELFDLLFDINNKIDLNLYMSDAELAKMQADYDRYDRNGSKSPIYRKADLHITITTTQGTQLRYSIPEVGVRMKGNTSRTDFYNSNDGIYNIIHLKLSFQETFDDPAYYGSDAKVWSDQARKERKNRTFATLEKLDLRWNRCNDSTYLKEYFAYATYRQYGVPAPYTNLATFNWAGIHMGVFTINEPVDKVFLEKRFPEEALGGDLYKIGWSGNQNGSFTDLHSIGIENEDEGKFYAYDLKTNKKTSSHGALKRLITQLNDGSVTKDEFVSLVDLDTFLPYCAVSYLLGNPDDLRNNYNNSYIYFRADNGKAVIIPYDFDRCLGVTTHWNPTGDGVTTDDPFGTTALGAQEEQRSPLMLYSICRGGFFVREYARILQQIADENWFTINNFAAHYSRVIAHYEMYTRPGKHFHNAQGLNLTFSLDRTSDHGSNGNISMREYLQVKISTLRYYLQKTDENANAQPPSGPVIWYIRGDYTNWSNSNDHILHPEGDLWIYEITLTKRSKLKVYNDQTGEWFGAECIPDDCSVSFETDGHTNIVLSPGSYRILFDPVQLIITIEEQL